MNLSEFLRRVEGFDQLGSTDEIRLFGWFLHTHGNAERFSLEDLGKCFDEAHVQRPDNLRQLVNQLVGRDFIRDSTEGS